MHEHKQIVLTLLSGPPSSMDPQEHIPDPLDNFLTLRHHTINNTIAVNTLPARSRTRASYDTTPVSSATLDDGRTSTHSYPADADLALPTESTPPLMLSSSAWHGQSWWDEHSRHLWPPEDGDRGEHPQKYTTLVINNLRRCLHGRTNRSCRVVLRLHKSSRS